MMHAAPMTRLTRSWPKEKGNVIRQAQMLKHLGIKPTKSLPSAMLDLAMSGEPGDLFEDPPEEPESLLELTTSPDTVAADQNHD